MHATTRCPVGAMVGCSAQPSSILADHGSSASPDTGCSTFSRAQPAGRTLPRSLRSDGSLWQGGQPLVEWFAVRISAGPRTWAHVVPACLTCANGNGDTLPSCAKTMAAEAAKIALLTLTAESPLLGEPERLRRQRAVHHVRQHLRGDGREVVARASTQATGCGVRIQTAAPTSSPITSRRVGPDSSLRSIL